MNKCSKRLSSFELIRIVAMLMIVAAHLAQHGIMHCLDKEDAYVLWNEGSIVNQLFSTALTIGARLGVALFFMLTGYFMIYDDKIRLSKLFGTTLFYSIFTILLFIIPWFLGYRFPEINIKSLLKEPMRTIFLPLSGGGWWFITAYVFLILFHPIVNKVVENINKKGYELLICVSWLLYYFLGSLLNVPYYTIQVGVFFYLIGGFIRKYILIDLMRKWWKSLLYIIITLFIVFTVFAYVGTLQQLGEILLITKWIAKFMFWVNDYIIIPISAIAFFLLLGALPMEYNELINKIASTTVGVYLLHDSLYGRSLIWRGILKVDILWYKSPFFPIVAIFFILLVFIVCSLTDMLRIRFFEPIIKQKFDKLENSILQKYMCEFLVYSEQADSEET